MTKIIAVSNHKGGVGKTTSTVNLGAALTLKGYSVCLVDLDPQANLTQSLIHSHRIMGTIYDNLKHDTVPYPILVNEKLSVIPSCLDLAAAESEFISEPGREHLLKNRLLVLVKFLNLDYILIDCPPSLGILTINAFTAAQRILIPLHAEYLPFNGLVRLEEVINKVKVRLNTQLEISGVFLTKYNRQIILNRDVKEGVQKHFGNKFLETAISTNIALAEAPSIQKDIFSYDNKCKGALDYMALCEEILEREGLNEKEKL